MQCIFLFANQSNVFQYKKVFSRGIFHTLKTCQNSAFTEKHIISAL